MKSISIIYYSESGSTRKTAHLLHERLGGKFENINDIYNNNVLFSEVIIFCTPNKYGKPAAPILDFIKRNPRQLSDREVYICFTCMDCYSTPGSVYACPVYRDSHFKDQIKLVSAMNGWEKSHAIEKYLQSIENILPLESLKGLAFFKGKLCFRELRFFDAMIMRFICFINPKIKQGDYLKEEDVIEWANRLRLLL